MGKRLLSNSVLCANKLVVVVICVVPSASDSNLSLILGSAFALACALSALALGGFAAIADSTIPPLL